MDGLTSDFEIQDELPVNLLSPSSISILMTCPEKFRRGYVMEKVPYKAGPWGVSGTAFHETRRFILATKRDEGRTPTEDELGIEFDRHFLEAAQAAELDGPTTHEIREAGWAMLRVYNQKIAPSLPAPIHLEVGARLHVPGVPIVVYGKIDAEFEDFILDTKTGRQAPKQPKPEWTIAGLIYMAMTGKPIRWHTIAAQKGGNITWSTEPHMGWRQSRLELAHAHVREAYETLLWLMRSHGPDRPWPGTGVATGSCRYCQFKRACPFYVS